MVFIEKNIRTARRFWQSATTGVLVLVGFFALVFAAVPRISGSSSHNLFGPDITHADAPASSGDSAYSSGGGGDSGSGGSDSGGDGGGGGGGGGGGCDGGGGGGCGD